MKKHISKEIAKRSKLRNKFLKTRNDTGKFSYNKQRNFWVSLIRKEKSKYFSNLNIKDVTDNKKFWKTIKSCFSDKYKNSERLVLTENDEIVVEDGKVALTLNTFFFSNIVTSLNIPKFKNCNTLSGRIPQPTLRAILKYENHPSISAIKKYNRTRHQFFCSVVWKEKIIKELQKLNPKKVTQETDTPVKILKDNKDFFAGYFQMLFNDAITSSIFPSLKMAYVKAVFKKGTKSH